MTNKGSILSTATAVVGELIMYHVLKMMMMMMMMMMITMISMRMMMMMMMNMSVQSS